MTNLESLIKLMKENPELPVVPMVDSDVVYDGEWCSWWLGSWGYCEVTEYYCGKERVHLKEDDTEDVLSDMVDCEPYMTKEGMDVVDLSDEEQQKLFDSLPWVKAIVVYIGIPD